MAALFFDLCVFLLGFVVFTTSINSSAASAAVFSSSLSSTKNASSLATAGFARILMLFLLILSSRLSATNICSVAADISVSAV